MAGGEGDDWWEKITDYFIRKTFIGFGGKFLIDKLITIGLLMLDDDREEAMDKVIRQVNPILPPGGKEVIATGRTIYHLLEPKD